ncbi:hypothetical protein MXB_3013 [Myxobolus squamalis]|nr:hypothetical protein MXB_3013 [Myxobolus squamalis]
MKIGQNTRCGMVKNVNGL